MVFCKSKLCLGSDAAVAMTLHVFWQTLGLFSETNDIKTALEERFQTLQAGITELFVNGVIKKAQVQQIMDYTRQTLFGHL
jgi:hypothetical protein